MEAYLRPAWDEYQRALAGTPNTCFRFKLNSRADPE